MPLYHAGKGVLRYHEAEQSIHPPPNVTAHGFGGLDMPLKERMITIKPEEMQQQLKPRPVLVD